VYYTLITGASSGIGLELAKICARHKQNLILVARSKPALDLVANELRETCSVKVEVFPMDLSQEASPTLLFDQLLAMHLMINVLINNAGFGDHGRFVQSDWTRQKEMIQVNVMALTQLTHLFLPRMIANQNGKILNVASVAAFQPGPLMSVYYATKAFVLSFSEALAEELIDSGVTVTALCPGPTASGFQKVANMSDLPALTFLKIPTSQQVAEFGFEAMKSGQSVAIHGAINQLVVQSLRITPRKLIVKLVHRLQEKRKQP
jgi:short-subunit dehydrogenase